MMSEYTKESLSASMAEWSNTSGALVHRKLGGNFLKAGLLLIGVLF
jgi:hypothetical protein